MGAYCRWHDKELADVAEHEQEQCLAYGWDCRECPYFGKEDIVEDEMERLTTRNDTGKAVLKQPYKCERCGEETWSLSDHGNRDPIDKLAEYEDLEEQGKLIRLPCAVGSTVYEIYQFLGEGAWEIDVHKIRLEDLDKIGKTVFLSRGETEAEIRRADQELVEGKDESDRNCKKS